MKNAARTGYTVGIGLTDRCNVNCSHCYSRPANGPKDLDFDLFCRLVEGLPIKSINLGTGESYLYPRFKDVLSFLAERRIEVAVTTNGWTVAELTDQELSLLHDVDFSLDYPDRATNDRWRGEGAYDKVMEGVKRCRDLGVEASLVTCLMKENSSQMGKLADLAVNINLNLRVNVYKSVVSKQYQPSYEEFWGAISAMAKSACFIACSEPVVSAAIGNRGQVKGNPCGKMSFRVHPDARVVACVYLQESDVTVEKMIADHVLQTQCLGDALKLPLPDVCRKCLYLDICNGGCASRRILNDPAKPDEYCFMIREDRPRIETRWRESKGLVHEDYLCTMIFSG
jgi:radical SAM protein with 4Fe4S-binding SPASM domain